MKRFLFTLISLLLLTSIGQTQCSFEMQVAQGDMNPGPLTSSYGVGSFIYYHSVGDYADLNDPILLEIDLLNCEPVNGVNSLIGASTFYFNWQYDSLTNNLIGTQNQTFFANFSVDIKLNFIVTNPVACPSNQIGFTTTLFPPVCYQGPPLFSESVYACYNGASNCNLGGITSTLNGLDATFGFINTGSTNVTWNFGDGNTGTGMSVTHTYSQPGVYSVSANTTESPGPCTYTVTINNILCDVITTFNPISCSGTNDGLITASPLGSPPFSYLWSSGQTTATISNLQPGNYTVMVEDDQGCVTYGSETLAYPTLNTSINNLTVDIDILPSLVSGTTYNWDFGDGNTSTSAPPLTHTYALSGTYTINVSTTHPVTTNVCNFQSSVFVEVLCQDTSIIDLTIPCSSQYVPVCGCDSVTYLNDCTAENHYGILSWSPGHCTSACPAVISHAVNNLDVDFNLAGHQNGVQYLLWSFGDGNASANLNPTHTYSLPGLYNVSVIVLDTLLNQCTYYALVEVGTVQLCIDATLIDLGANCPGYNPVCGCNGITYTNPCIAENCFGVSSWVFGPCATPQDTTCTTTSSFTYTDSQTPTGHDVSFFGAGTGTGSLVYFWDFGDGDVATGINTTHTYSDTTSIDSVQAFNVCLAVLDGVQCVASYCETIVVVVNPNGNISGGIYEDSNFTSDGGVVTAGKSGNGDPIPNVTVHLERADGLILQTATTDSLGIYGFGQLQFGDYRIRIDMPGITHNGEPIKLSPIVQQKSNFDFEVDDDGNVSTEIDGLTEQYTFELMPNPASDQLTLEISAKEKQMATIQIINLTGQSVYQEQVSLQKGIQNHQINLKELTNGIYFIILQNEQGSVSKKLIKQ